MTLNDRDAQPYAI